MSYTVTVSLVYRRGCSDCTLDAERVVLQALRDAQVTAISLRAVPKCTHKPTHHLNASPARPAPPVGTDGSDNLVLPMDLSADMPSDVNGFDPEERQ